MKKISIGIMISSSSFLCSAALTSCYSTYHTSAPLLRLGEFDIATEFKMEYMFSNARYFSKNGHINTIDDYWISLDCTIKTQENFTPQTLYWTDSREELHGIQAHIRYNDNSLIDFVSLQDIDEMNQINDFVYGEYIFRANETKTFKWIFHVKFPENIKHNEIRYTSFGIIPWYLSSGVHFYGTEIVGDLS